MDTNFLLFKAKPEDVEDIAQQIEAMAFETIHKRLDLKDLIATVAGFLERPELGNYYVVKKDNQNIASFFITWGHTQCTQNPEWWFGTV
jgi:hypothetical protein